MKMQLKAGDVVEIDNDSWYDHRRQYLVVECGERANSFSFNLVLEDLETKKRDYRVVPAIHIKRKI